MSKTAPVCLCVLVVLIVSASLAAQSAQELYQRGLVQEQANGDLAQAIALYSQAAKTAGKDRGLAAKALIHVAGAQEKLGRESEAASAYSEVLRKYPEQRAEVAIAKQRLAALRQAAQADDEASVPDLTDAELASRVAALVWNAAPDSMLLAVAGRGGLRDRTTLHRQLLRMLRDPRADSLIDRFFTDWLALDRLRQAEPDAALYPQFDAELRQAMQTETRLFLQSQLREDRDAVDLWTANYTFVNERLARHYGISGVSGRDFTRVLWPNANRAGLLGQAGILTALSQPRRTSPTVRGVFVLTRFLGIDAPPPPANVPALAEGADAPAGTLRDRMSAHRVNPACANCHSRFDPLGFALENFDAIGAWRTSDGGAPIDASGTFMDGTRFNGPAELRAGLLRYRDAYYVALAQRLLAFGLNRRGRGGVYDYEMPAVRQIVRDAAPENYSWSSMLAAVASSAPFQMKHVVP
jgi:tetratricopeptide (TPR) repeat protein